MSDKEFILTSLTREFIDETVALCEESVGKNLYDRKVFENAVDSSDSHIFLYLTKDRRVAAYLYVGVIDFEEAVAISKNDLKELEVLSGKKSPKIAHFKSIGVRPEYRMHGLAEKLMFAADDWFYNDTDADAAIGIAWKPNGKAVMDKILVELDFSYLTDLKMFWYDNEEMYCPVCKGRCRCDAALYGKMLTRDKIDASDS